MTTFEKAVQCTMILIGHRNQVTHTDIREATELTMGLVNRFDPENDVSFTAVMDEVRTRFGDCFYVE
jgi:hypothetical protein